MAIWIDEESKILIQGITGKQGTFHGTRMVRYNTNVVGGVTPGKGGQEVDQDGRRVPVYNNMKEAVSETGADVSAIYVPARFAAAAIHELALVTLHLRPRRVVPDDLFISLEPRGARERHRTFLPVRSADCSRLTLLALQRYKTLLPHIRISEH